MSKVLISVSPTNATITGDIPGRVITILRNELSYEPETVRYQLRVVQSRNPDAHWDTFTHLFVYVPPNAWRFPSGLVNRVSMLLNQNSVEHDVVYEPLLNSTSIYPDFHVSLTNPLYKLRDYQDEASTTAIEEKHGIIQHCTGSGKTITIAATIAKADVYPALVVVPTDVLLHQTRERISEILQCPIGGLGRKNGKQLRDLQPITVATMQTITSMRKNETDDVYEYLQNVKSLHIDEAHHARANTVQAIVDACTSAEYKLGWSGTPFREQGDDLEIEGALGRIIHTYMYSDAIDRGFIVPPHIYRVTMDPGFSRETLKDIKDNWTYNDVITAYVVNNSNRNAGIASVINMLEENNEKTLVLVGRIKHGEILSKLLDVEFVQGKSQDAYKTAVLNGLRNGKHKTVIATPLLDEGVDIPEVTALVLAMPGKSLVKSYQRIGRVVRKAPGKTRCIIVDITDNIPMLKYQAKHRLDLYRREPRFVINDIGGNLYGG